MRRRILSALLLGLSLASVAHAQHIEHADDYGGRHVEEHADQHEEAGGHGAGAHGEEHINWAHGFVGEQEGAEPGLLWRPVGMPPPLLANFLNAALLFFILYWFGRGPVAEGLKKRKARIVAGMDEAGRMKADAEQSLAKYEDKLKRIDDEIERVRREMRESAEAERKHILAEAKERRERMEREARVLVEQELKAAREELMRETVRSAVRSAGELLQKQISGQDHDRLASEYLELLNKSGVNATGGKA